jgi:flagellar biosynthesis/type III secretory pathway protein FliH
MKTVVILLIISFTIGFYFGRTNTNEKIIYQPKIEYIKDPNSVSKSTLESEVANAKKSSYDAGYLEGRKIGTAEGQKIGATEGRKIGIDEGRRAGIDEGYKSGYTQGTEYGKSLILDQIDLRVQEAERTNTNIPLFRVRQE